MKNPHQVLGVPQNASEDDIKKAFKKLAILNHPDKGGDPEKFKQINNAYISLSQPNQDPRTSQFHDVSHMFNMFHHFQSSQQVFRRNVEIRISLEDIYKDKEFSIKGQRLNVPAGTPLFSNLEIEKDLVIVLKHTKHPIFEVDQHGNLVMKQSISLYECLTGFRKRIKHPSNKMFFISINEIIHPGFQKVYQGKGIPIGNNIQISNLIVIFEIIFPKKIDSEKHAEDLKRIFGCNLPTIIPQDSDEKLM